MALCVRNFLAEQLWAPPTEGTPGTTWLELLAAFVKSGSRTRKCDDEVKNTNIAETKLRECLELSILESKKAYLHSPGRRFFKQLIESKSSELSNNEGYSSKIKELKNMFERSKGIRQDTEAPPGTKSTQSRYKNETPLTTTENTETEREAYKENSPFLYFLSLLGVFHFCIYFV